MSTSPTFKYRGPDKRCPFPFNRDDANYSYGVSVALTASGGDEGLAEACRIWWLLESISFSASCTFSSASGGTIPLSISSATDPAVGGFPRFLDPVDRCEGAGFGLICGYGSTSGYDCIYVSIHYSDGAWRMSAEVNDLTYSDPDGTVSYRISDQATGTGYDEELGYYYSIADAGNVTILGYIFPTRFSQVAYADSAWMDWSISGQSMSLTGTFYTLV